GFIVRQIFKRSDVIFEFIHTYETKKSYKEMLMDNNPIELDFFTFIKGEVFIFQTEFNGLTKNIHPNIQYIIKDYEIEFLDPRGLFIYDNQNIIKLIDPIENLHILDFNIMESYSPYLNKLKLLS